MLEMIRELCTLPGISGRENAVRDYIIDKIEGYAEYSVDPLGNLLVFKKGRKPANKKVMLDAHMDEVGLIITAITSEGYLHFTKVGGIDTRVILGRTVKVGEKAVNGVIGVKPVHLVDKGAEADIPKADDLYIDIGASSREEAAEYVSLGDSVWFAGDFVEFGEGFVKSKALDDRVGCAILIEMISIAPDYAVVVETTTAADISGVKDEKRVCLCGKGGTVSFMDRSTLYSRELFDRAFEIAEDKGIAIQPKTLVAGGNDAGAIHKSRGGVKVLTVSVPCRYLHSPGGVIKYSDAEESLKLVKALAEDFAK